MTFRNGILATLLGAAAIGVGIAATRSQKRGLGDALPRGKRRACTLHPARKVSKLLGLDKPQLPEHIQKFGHYMVWMSGKKLEPADVAKAYLITTSSIQRRDQSCEKVAAYWPGVPCAPGEDIRPEHVMSKILLTPEGKRYLAAASQGRYDRRAASWMAGMFASFGLAGQIRTSLREAPKLAAESEAIERILRQGTRRQWMEYVAKNVKGVSYAKSGFLAAILGRGDLTTADAREEDLWRPEDAKGTKIDADFVERLNRRLTALNVETPPELRPFYQHLVHHFLWDKIGGAQVFHTEIKDCMAEGATPEARSSFFGARMRALG